MTVKVIEPRLQFTVNSFGFKIETVPTEGSSPVGRITAVPACKTKALEFAVEKVADPLFSVAEGLSDSALHKTRLPPAICKRAGPARNCMLPSFSVSRLSPLKTVVPTDAGA